MNLANYDKNSQVNLAKVTMTKPNSNKVLDIRHLVDQIILFEDLFSPSITATLVFRDQLNLVGSLPIVGGEVIDIQYNTPVYNEIITLQFIVYKIGERGLSNNSENIQINQLFLCTPEVWLAANIDVSSGLQGTYADIIGKLIATTNTKKAVDSEQSVGIVTYAVPSINAFQAIKFCATRANSQTLSPMFFWETAKGYRFQSLKSIYRAAFTKFIYIEDRSVAGADKSADKAFNTCFSFEYSESNDRLSQFNTDAFGGDALMVDQTNRRITKNHNSYDELFNKNDIKLNKFPLNDPMSALRTNDFYLPYRSDLSHLTGYNRIATLAMMDNLKLMVSIPGDSGLKAGDVVWLEIPAKVGLNIGVEKLSAGKWLVRSLKHLITKTEYTMILELTKDSFDIDVTI